MIVKYIRRVDRYFSRDGWSLIAFQPILYLFVFGAVVRLIFTAAEIPDFDFIINGFYNVWLALGILGPLQTWFAWFLMQKCSGILSFIGMWVRLSADIEVLTVVSAYMMVLYGNHNSVVREVDIFSRYLDSAIVVFIVGLIVRDVWVLYITERTARRISRGEE